ncbi:TIGR04372 family glycosyltransferase [Candidatus Pelagibacter ubique]|nr:TIGR04372 family glycosyltransferase [Candidatus Pelagibacter ubique]
MKIISNIVDKSLIYLNKPYFFIYPEDVPSTATYKNFLSNSLFFLLNKYYINLFKCVIKIMIKLFFDLSKIIYLPISLLFYISSYRFIQIDYSQFGCFINQLEVMVKYNHLRNKKSLIFIPSSQSRSYIKKIFPNLIITDSIILNILAQPLIHSSFISCPIIIAENLFDKDFKKIGKFYSTKIKQDFNKKKNNPEFFKLDKEYCDEMKKIFNKKFKNFEIKKTVLIHIRDSNFNMATDLRSASLESYTPTIEYLLLNGYFVIRLIHSKSKKLTFPKNYEEINTDELINQYLQYYLVSKSKAFINTQSGPGPLGSLFDRPALSVNHFYHYSYAYKKNDIFLFKKIKNSKGQVQNFTNLFNHNFYEKYPNSISLMIKHGYEVLENTSDEILEATKELLTLDSGDMKYSSRNAKQQLFVDSLPETSCFKYMDSRISSYFQKKNPELF